MNKRSPGKTRTKRSASIWLAGFLAMAAAAPAHGTLPAESPTGADTLAYRLPAPPAATYEITNASSLSAGTPMGNMELDIDIAMTLELAFAAAEGGEMRVTGEVTAFELSTSDPFMGTPQSTGLEAVGGALDLTLNRQGQTGIANRLTMAAQMEQFSIFETVRHSIFPRLPGQEAEPGAMWVDTVAQVFDDSGSSNTTIFNYTLVGDTMVENRMLSKIELTGDLRIQETVTTGVTTEMTTEMAGPFSGFLLWDRERGLVAGSEIEQTLEGTTKASVTSMEPMSVQMSMSSTERVRLLEASERP